MNDPSKIISINFLKDPNLDTSNIPLFVYLFEKIHQGFMHSLDGLPTVVIPRDLKGCYETDSFVSLVFKYMKTCLKEEHYDTAKDNRGKSNANSVKYRGEGNQRFVSTNDHDCLVKALEFYTGSIAAAVPGSKEVSLGYANRAALLLKFDRPEECLEDIRRAMEYGYPEELRPKLLIRQAECFANFATRNYIEARRWVNKVPAKDPLRESMAKKLKNYPSTMKGADIVDEECLIPKIKSPNKKFPCASDALDLDCSSLNGRPNKRIVATRDIQVGEVLLVERAYFQCLKVNWHYTNCSYCLTSLLNGIPCDTCGHAVYCSEECKAAAWAEYHEVECPVFGLLIPNWELSVSTIALRLLIQMRNEAGGLQQLKKRVEEFNADKNADPSVMKDEWFKKLSLEGILCTNKYEMDMPHAEFRASAVLALCSLFVMASRTNFFGIQYKSHDTFDALMRNPAILFFAKFLIKLAVIGRNSYQFGPRQENSGNTNLKGDSLYGFASFVSHSCISNADVQSKKNHLVLRSVIPIKKGEQIFISFTAPWAFRPLQERQSVLRRSFYITTCSCRACRENWPTQDLAEHKIMYPHYNQSQVLNDRNISVKIARRQKCIEQIESASRKIQARDLSEKDKMLKTLYQLVNYIYDNDLVPCYELGYVRGLLMEIFRITGSCSKLQTNFARK